MNIEPIPFEPEESQSMLARLPAALETVLDYRNGPPPLELSPGLLRKHIFDFPDGVRAIISRELNRPRYEDAIHISFSIAPHFAHLWVMDDFLIRSAELVFFFDLGRILSSHLTLRAFHCWVSVGFPTDTTA